MLASPQLVKPRGSFLEARSGRTTRTAAAGLCSRPAFPAPDPTQRFPGPSRQHHSFARQPLGGELLKHLKISYSRLERGIAVFAPVARPDHRSTDSVGEVRAGRNQIIIPREAPSPLRVGNSRQLEAKSLADMEQHLRLRHEGPDYLGLGS